MKKILLLLAVAVTVFACQSGKDSYTIKGTISGLDTGKVYLLKIAENQPVAVDTADLVGGKFEFKGKMEVPDIRILRLNDRNYFAQFFLDNSKVTVAANKDSLRATKVTGSPENDVFTIYLNEIERLNKEGMKLQQQYQQALASGDQAKVDQIKIDAQAMSENMLVFTKNFVKEHNNSVVSAYVILWQLAGQIEGAELDSIVAKYPAEISKSEYVAQVKKMADEMRKTAVGAEAPDFTMNDPEGKPIQLSSLRGKVVMIDFWASWCAPCRQENPNVVALYNKYHDKGFEILGVSLDRTKEDWTKAIADDKLIWLHVSDLQFWQNEVARLYGVNSIPQTFLIDKEGKIIGKGLRGEKLEQKLSELFPM
jgi:peroxiredoxin